MNCSMMRDCLTVEVDGIQMTGSQPRGDGYGLTGLEGYWDGPEMEGGVARREYADGAAEGQVTGVPRIFTLEGTIRARHPFDLSAMMDDLAGVLTENRFGWVTFSDATLGRDVRAWVKCPRKRIQRTSRSRAVFSMTLESVDWRLLGTEYERLTLKPGESGAFTNRGNVTGDLLATLTGPLTNPSISWGGNTWRFNGTVAAGKTLGVTFPERVVRDPADAARYRRLVTGPWPEMTPGTTTYTVGGTGTGSVYLHGYSAWS